MNRFKYLKIKIKDWWNIKKKLRTLRRMKKNLKKIKRPYEESYFTYDCLSDLEDNDHIPSII